MNPLMRGSMEVLIFPDQVREGHYCWCGVELREPKTESKPYNQEKHSIYLSMWEGERTGIYLTPKEARKIALWLLHAADITEERNEE